MDLGAELRADIGAEEHIGPNLEFGSLFPLATVQPSASSAHLLVALYS